MDILINFRTFCNRPCFFCPLYLLLTYNFVSFSFSVKKLVVHKNKVFRFEKKMLKFIAVGRQMFLGMQDFYFARI